MNTTHIEVEVPAGRYWLGDPCYVVQDELWQDLLKSCAFFKAPVGQVNGHEVLAFFTATGDGLYPSSDDHLFSVDAGLIGLTPHGLAAADFNEVQMALGRGCWVEFEEPTTCSSHNGVLIFGDIEIDTN
jgi:hypothetical protein